MTKKLTKKEKAAYPEFIACIDLLASADPNTGFKTKAMEETTLLDAMRRMEAVIKEHGKEIYLVDILAKTGEETEIGEPLYKTALMTRVHPSDYADESCRPSEWHFRDEAHQENDHGFYVWHASHDRRGTLQFYKR